MLLLSIHVRHGCYLMQGHYTCLGTKETLSEMLGMMDKSPSTRMKEHDERNRRKATGPGHPAPEDVNNSSSPAAEVLQAPDIRRQPRTSDASRRPGHPAFPWKSVKNNRSKQVFNFSSSFRLSTSSMNLKESRQAKSWSLTCSSWVCLHMAFTFFAFKETMASVFI